MINRVILVGRLVKNPELRTGTNSGTSICSFTVAAESKMKKEDGTRSTCFMPCVCFGQTAENVAKSMRKGSLVGVDGYLNQRKYQRNDETTAFVIEVICDAVKFLEPKEKGGMGREEVPPFDFPSTGNSKAHVEEEDTADNEDSRNLDSLNLPDEDLPF